MNVGIVAQRGNENATDLAGALCEMLDEEDVSIWVDEATSEHVDARGVDVDRMTECNLVVSIGGDWTFLFAARGAGGTPILGVNLGEVGFLNAVAPEDAVSAVRRELERYRETGEVRHREVPRAAASGEREWSLTPALNEVVIQGEQRGHGHGVDVEVRVDGSLFEATHADGVLVATPTGSTAYNLSEGGPLVQPGVGAFVVNEMCADGAMPPLLTPVGGEVTVRVDGPGHAVVSSDGSNRQRVKTPEVVTVEAADEPARVAGPDSDFFQALNKLK